MSIGIVSIAIVTTSTCTPPSYAYCGCTYQGGGRLSQAHPLYLIWLYLLYPIPTKVEDVYRKHIQSLRVCYQHYSGVDYDGYFSNGDALSLDEFVTLLSDADLLDNCLTRKEAGHVFVHSQMFVTDEARTPHPAPAPHCTATAPHRTAQHSTAPAPAPAPHHTAPPRNTAPPHTAATPYPSSGEAAEQASSTYTILTMAVLTPPQVKRREKLLNLSFEGFLEALGRLTLFKAMPTASQIVERKMDSPAVFFDRLDSEGEFAGWVSKNAPSYAKEEMAGRSLHEVLDG